MDEQMRMLIMSSMGEAIIVETMKSAAYFVSRSGNNFKPKHHVTKQFLQESRYCYYFVQGTGLDILINDYQLDLDPEELRNQFNYLVRHSA